MYSKSISFNMNIDVTNHGEQTVTMTFKFKSQGHIACAVGLANISQICLSLYLRLYLCRPILPVTEKKFLFKI